MLTYSESLVICGLNLKKVARDTSASG